MPRFESVDLAGLFNAAPNPYVILDREFVIVGMNEAYLRVTGRRREEIVGRALLEAFPAPPDSEGGRALRASLARVLADNEPDHIAIIPYPIEDEQGVVRERYWSATHTPLRDGDGNLVFILQHTVDVTEIQKLRQQSLAGAASQQGMLERAGAIQARNALLLEEQEYLRNMFDQAPSFMAVLRGPRHVFDLANAAYLQITGHRQLVGRSVAEALPEVVDQGFIELLDTVLQTGKPFVGRGMRIMLQTEPDAPLSERYLDFIYQPIASGDETIGIFVQGHDITEQKRAEQALERQSGFLRLAQDAGGIGTFSFDLDTGMVEGSDTFFALYGLPPSPQGMPIVDIVATVLPEDREMLTTSRSRSVEETSKFTEYRALTVRGVRWIARQGEVMRDGDGRPCRIIGAAYDITARREAEEQLRLLMDESAHRMKNMLALVHAITDQALRGAGTVAEARQAVGSRLVALSQAHDTLVGNNWGRTSIRDTVAAAARLHGDLEERFTIDGPDLVLPPKAALGLALMLHELGTNALKYGALSTPAGRVGIDWTSAGDGAAVDFTWRETDGPAVVLPTRSGFGSRLIERGLVGYLGGPVNLDYAPQGLICRARIDLGGDPAAMASA